MKLSIHRGYTLKLSIHRGYEKLPRPDSEKLHEASRHFYQGILTSLKSKSISPVHVPMQHDIWRYITNGKGTASRHTGFWLYSIPDLSRLPLPEHWWYFLNKSHEEGYAVQPPMKIKPVLSWTFPRKIRKDNKIMAAPRLPVERLRIDILKRPCNSENIGV